MDERLGIHLGREAVTAVALTADGAVRDWARWPPPEGQEHWHYSESDVDVLGAHLNERFNPERSTVAVSIPIEAIYFRRVEVPDTDEAGDEAVRYAAEPLLPMPLDQLHLAIRRSGDHAEVLALPLEPWGRVLRALDQAGWLCPKAVCDAEAFVQHIKREEQDNEQPELLAALDAERGVAGVRRGDGLWALRPLAASPPGDRLRQELERTGRGACGEMVYTTRVWESETKHQEPSQSANAEYFAECALVDQLLPDGLPPLLGSLAAWHAASALGDPAVMNLRGGPLGSTSIQRRTQRWLFAHAGAAALMILVLAGVLVFRGDRLQGQAAIYKADARRVWLELFPDRQPPRDIVSLLVSEQVRERGVREGADAVPRYAPALNVLDRLIAGMPKDVRLRVQQIELTDEISVITGQARGHGKVEQIAAGMNQAAGFTVEPPQTRRIDAGPVRFTIRFDQGGDDD